MKILALVLALASSAWAVFDNNVLEQTQNVNAIQTAQTARWDAYKASNCSGAIRASNWGHSISMGEYCSGAVNDGYRRVLTPALADKGLFIKWSGVQVVGSTTVLECPGTNLPGASPTIQMIYNSITSVAATRFPTPTANDWAFIGPALTNSATQGQSQQTMQDCLIACITNTAAAIPDGKIFVSNDIARGDGVSLTNALAAATYAFTWTKAQGYNVYFLDINSCSVALCGDNLHPTTDGQDALGACMTSKLLTALGQ